LILLIGMVHGCCNYGPFHECGIDPSTHRTFSSGAGAVHDLVKTRVVTFIGMQNAGIVISINHYEHSSQNEHHSAYASDDLGKSWKDVTKDYLSKSKSIIVSNSDLKTLYQPVSGVRGVYISVSHDEGKSWENVRSMIDGTIPITDFTIVETSFRKSNRLYGKVSYTKTPGIYISDDCGKTLRLFAKNLNVVKESKSDSILYGVGGSPIYVASMGLVISFDQGKSWELLKNASELFKPVYRNMSKGEVYSYREDPNDEEISFSYPIDQIEIDPSNSNIIYLKGYKGLYRSIDRGKSFLLLPLAKNLLYGIDEIRLDSQNGRYVFASVNKDSIYRSDNYGCSWEKLLLPE